MGTVASFWVDATPLASMAVCFCGIVGIILARKLPNVREGISLTTAVVNFGLVLWMYFRFQGGETIAVTLADFGEGLEIAFRVDALGILFALVASSLWIVNTLYSIGYMRAHNEHKQTRFYACFALAIAAVMGGAFSANLLSLFIFYELLTLGTYPLVIHAETDKARAGAKRYVTYLLGTSIGLQLPALFLVYWLAGGRTDFVDSGLLSTVAATRELDHFLVGLCFVLFIGGMAKCGIMPFHAWLPAAMVAPTPVSALLHAVAVVKMGVFGICRVVCHVFGTDILADVGVNDVLVVMACFTIVMASMVALAQDNLKRRLAYSTVSQLSYVLLGVALLAPAAQTGGVAHIGIHAFSKITLFFAAGAIYVAHHKTLVSQLDGLARRMPITMTAFAIGAFSMIGLPPAAGIVSKWYIAEGAGSDPRYYAVLGVLFVSALLNAGYFLPILWRAFFKPVPEDEDDTRKEAPWPCVVALSVTAAGTLLLFFGQDLVTDLARAVATAGGGS